MVRLVEQLKKMVPKDHYADEYKQILRDHQQELIDSPNTSRIEIDPDVAENATGDLTSILRHYKINARLHWPICLINGLDSPMSYTPDIVHLLIPDMDEIRKLHTYYKTLHKI